MSQSFGIVIDNKVAEESDVSEQVNLVCVKPLQIPSSLGQRGGIEGGPLRLKIQQKKLGLGGFEVAVIGHDWCGGRGGCPHWRHRW